MITVPLTGLILLQAPACLIVMSNFLSRESNDHPMTIFMCTLLLSIIVPMCFFTFLSAQYVADQVYAKK